VPETGVNLRECAENPLDFAVKLIVAIFSDVCEVVPFVPDDASGQHPLSVAVDIGG